MMLILEYLSRTRDVNDVGNDGGLIDSVGRGMQLGYL